MPLDEVNSIHYRHDHHCDCATATAVASGWVKTSETHDTPNAEPDGFAFFVLLNRKERRERQGFCSKSFAFFAPLW